MKAFVESYGEGNVTAQQVYNYIWGHGAKIEVTELLRKIEPTYSHLEAPFFHKKKAENISFFSKIVRIFGLKSLAA
ncbi:hypothetical protein [Leptospira levettii]|uniref:hypothetical protein n=1 Tax=Leptospira levettii TaxID=2023178 RepID=UPI000CAF1D26|nr:hypothetical protein [Leptospira levettii]PJZ89505.1 hypothetical protein CH368_05985 [Leptospira levettii]